MKINEMFDRVLLRSGQFILRKSNIEIDIDSFRLLVEDTLAVYNKAKPFSKNYTQRIIYPREFVFQTTFDPEIGRIPDWISEATPIVYSGFVNSSVFGMNSQNDELINPLQAPWVYNKPVLNVPFSAKYSIIAVYKHIIEQIPNSFDENGRVIYEVKTISYEDNLFLDLLRSYFLSGIGRSRRAFTLNDLPILMDADQIASEGKELEDNTLEKLRTIQDISLAWG